MPFRDVAGHRRLLSLISRSIERDSLPPSLIFAGPDGVGKRLVAMSIAQALNCLDPVRSDNPDLRFDACGKCASCRRIARGVHPDVIVLEPSENGNIRIDQVRDPIDRAGYRPFEGRRRVVVIDDADRLMVQAQNALLKILEEPPSTSAFILVTSTPHVLLPTVLSRCPRLRFGPLDLSDIVQALVTLGRPQAEARAVAAVAGGSVGRALAAAAGDLAAARDTALRVLTEAAVSNDPRKRLETARDLAPKGTGAPARDELAADLRAMATVIRDIELSSVQGSGEALANADVEPALKRLTPYAGQRGLRAFEAIHRALEALQSNAGVKVVADWIVLQL